MMPTAEQVAQALVVEARRAGVDPEKVFEQEMLFVRAKVVRAQPPGIQPVWARSLRVGLGSRA